MVHTPLNLLTAPLQNIAVVLGLYRPKVGGGGVPLLRTCLIAQCMKKSSLNYIPDGDTNHTIPHALLIAAWLALSIFFKRINNTYRN